MRPFYWDVGDRADLDDEHLAEAVSEGLVPAQCLLGGHLVRQLSDAGEKVCEWCPCPKRDICNGEPQKYSVDKEEGVPIRPSEQLHGDEKSARRIIRASFIRTLNDIVESSNG